jgi:hypothetical protein
MNFILGLVCGVILAAVGTSGTARAAPHEKSLACQGTACADVRIWYDGCYQAVNHGTKQVVLILGQWQKVLSPGERFTLKGVPNYKTCPKAYAGIAQANY